SVVTQCDTGQMIQIADATKRYLVSPIDPAEAQTKKKGGVVTYTTAVTDLGEKKTVLGQSARHLKVVVTKEFAGDVCDKKKQRVDPAGGSAARPAATACPAGDRRRAPAIANNCRDELKYVDPQSLPGSPLAYTAVTTGDDGKASTMTMEVTAI